MREFVVMDEKGKKFKLEWVIRLLGTGLFLWLILRSVNARDVFSLVKSISLPGYGFLFLLFLFKQFLTTFRWKLLLDVRGINLPLKDLYISVLYGQTLNQVLPSSIGGDSARVAYLFSRYPDKKSAGVSATLLDRFLGLFALIVIAFFDFPFVSGLSFHQKAIGISILGVIIILVALGLWGEFDSLFTWFLNLDMIPGVIGCQLDKFWTIFIEYRRDWKSLLKGFSLSIVSQGIMILGQYLTFQLIGVQVLLIRLFLVIPVVTLIITLPVSIGGIGVREAALVSMLAISSDAVVSFSIIRYSFYILIPVILFFDTMFRFERDSV